MATMTLKEVAQYRDKTVPCAGGCKRRLKRQKKFWQTLSPFNKNAAGVVKTASEIHDELDQEFKAWAAEPETCSHCKAS